MAVNSNITVENARIGFRNFSGKEGKFNAAGARNFCVFFEPEFGKTLEADGWNIRWLQPREEGEAEVPYLQVSIRFGKIPPKVYVITSRGKTALDEESINMLDWAEIEKVDLIIRPYNWVMSEGTRNEKSGAKAYLKSMYVTIVEDEFEKKYVNIPTEGIDEPVNGD